MLRIALLPLLLAGSLHAGIDLRLPTKNDHIFGDQPEKFYMHVDRTFEGVSSTPWQGGCYGYVRNSMRINDEVIHVRFHEGIDVRPLKRDRYNRPLDIINSIAPGKVVHVSASAGQSNYGRYVVVEHPWEGSSIYSLYAHLASVSCQRGQQVDAGSPLGRMGYSGSGLNRTRAHLHLELNMMLSTRFDDWAKGMINHHGNYNGMNLTGCDIARFYHEHRDNPELTFSEFITSTPVYFKVLCPGRGIPDFVKRHPWICEGDAHGAESWEISFSDTGMPIAFTPSTRTISAPTITAIRPSDIPHQYRTRNLVRGEGNRATLMTNGKKLVSLLMDDF